MFNVSHIKKFIDCPTSSIVTRLLHIKSPCLEQLNLPPGASFGNVCGRK